MKKAVTIAAGAALPALALAQTIDSVFVKVLTLINYLTIIVVALSVLAFFWGLFLFITKAGEEKSEGRHIMIWGILALFVMMSVWGLVSVLGNTFGVSNTVAPNIPGIGGFSGSTYGAGGTGGTGVTGGVNVTGGINIPIR
jgi:hypothetical protein